MATSVLAGCGGAPAAPAPVPPTVATVEGAASPTNTAPLATIRTTAAPPATTWTMPNLVGTDLQSAQDAVQALTGYGIAITRSHDVSGASRHQVLDRDWRVCTQNVAPGAPITATTGIDFGVVKLAERCR